MSDTHLISYFSFVCLCRPGGLQLLTTMTALIIVFCRLILRADMTADVLIRKPRPLRQSPILFFTRPSVAARLYTSSNRNMLSVSRLPTVTSLSSRILRRSRTASVTSANKIGDIFTGHRELKRPVTWRFCDVRILTALGLCNATHLSVWYCCHRLLMVHWRVGLHFRCCIWIRPWMAVSVEM
jgi:hypothetical protein